MIKTIIFDIVNVLIDYSWNTWADQEYGEEKRELIAHALWGSGHWRELDLGHWSDEEFLQHCYALEPEHTDLIREAFYKTGDCAERYPYVIPWIHELKAQGYQVLYLSNYPDCLVRMRPDALDFIPHMDGGVFSYEAHLVKPDAAIYEYICRKYQLNPSECLFIDDTKVNVDAAQAYGMHAIHFQGYETSYPEIMAYLR